MKTYLPTFIHISQVENSAYASIMLQVTSKQSYLGFHKAPLLVPFSLIVFFNDFFYFIETASVHNLADDNILSMFEETIQNLIALLEIESSAAIE